MTTTPTDDLPPLPEPDMWIPHSITELSASYTADQMRAYALSDRQARAAQGEPVATLHDDGCFTWKRDEYRLKYDRQRAGWRMDVYATPPAQPKAEPPLTESEQQSTAQPVAEAYQRGIVQGMNDVLHNGIDWARAKFGGAPLTASKPSEPAQDEALKVAVRMALDAMVKVGGSAEMTPGRYFDELAEPIDACRAALAQIDAISNPRQDESTP